MQKGHWPLHDAAPLHALSAISRETLRQLSHAGILAQRNFEKINAIVLSH